MKNPLSRRLNNNAVTMPLIMPCDTLTQITASAGVGKWMQRVHGHSIGLVASSLKGIFDPMYLKPRPAQQAVAPGARGRNRILGDGLEERQDQL